MEYIPRLDKPKIVALSTFGKNYKLCSQKTIASVFSTGKSVKSYPFVAHFIPQQFIDNQQFKLVFSAPKRMFRKAHNRNAIKRLMRESFREKKVILETFLAKEEQQLALFVIFTAKEPLSLLELNARTEKLIHKIIEEIQHEKQHL